MRFSASSAARREINSTLWAAVTKTDLHAAAIELCRRTQNDIPWIARS
jgi:hypothetical protein